MVQTAGCFCRTIPKIFRLGHNRSVTHSVITGTGSKKKILRLTNPCPLSRRKNKQPPGQLLLLAISNIKQRCCLEHILTDTDRLLVVDKKYLWIYPEKMLYLNINKPMAYRHHIVKFNILPDDMVHLSVMHEPIASCTYTERYHRNRELVVWPIPLAQSCPCQGNS